MKIFQLLLLLHCKLGLQLSVVNVQNSVPSEKCNSAVSQCDCALCIVFPVNVHCLWKSAGCRWSRRRSKIIDHQLGSRKLELHSISDSIVASRWTRFDSQWNQKLLRCKNWVQDLWSPSEFRQTWASLQSLRLLGGKLKVPKIQLLQRKNPDKVTKEQLVEGKLVLLSIFASEGKAAQLTQKKSRYSPCSTGNANPGSGNPWQWQGW